MGTGRGGRMDMHHGDRDIGKGRWGGSAVARQRGCGRPFWGIYSYMYIVRIVPDSPHIPLSKRKKPATRYARRHGGLVAMFAALVLHSAPPDNSAKH